MERNSKFSAEILNGKTDKEIIQIGLDMWSNLLFGGDPMYNFGAVIRGISERLGCSADTVTLQGKMNEINDKEAVDALVKEVMGG
jgi:hypothetical protein